MSCYDEELERMSGEERIDAVVSRRGPTVVRDCQNVREIAADPSAFALHVKPRYKMGRDDCWGPNGE